MAALITLAAIAFVSTNLDDLVVLLALFSDPTQRPRDVWAGQFLGMFTLTLVAVTCALAAASVPSPYVGLLGFLPLLIGLTRLVSRRGAREPNAPNAKKGSAENVFVAAAVTAANGGDNIAVYVPLLVGRSWPEITVIALVFSILTAIWCTVARVIVKRPRIGLMVTRLGPRCLPWFLIALGLYILIASRAHAIPGQ